MGMFDYVTFEGAPPPQHGGEPSRFQSKDGPCFLRLLDRDALDEDGAFLINEYYDGGDVWRRSPGGWVKASSNARRVAVNAAAEAEREWETTNHG